MSRRTKIISAATLALFLCGPAQADKERGPVTNLPMPRFVSIKAKEANVRRGPSLSHRIDWVYKRPNLPVKVIAEYGHWRRIQDFEGAGGWIHYSLISGVRMAVVPDGTIELRDKAQDYAPVSARLEEGVVARLGKCTIDWCKLRAKGGEGWARKSTFWGVDPKETRD